MIQIPPFLCNDQEKSQRGTQYYTLHITHVHYTPSLNDSEKQINATLLVTSVIFSYLELISDEDYAKMASIGSA